MLYIKVNGKYIQPKITPNQLEGIGELKRNRNGIVKSVNYFKKKPFQIIKRLCDAYQLEFFLNRKRDTKIKEVKLIIPGLGIDIISYGRSNRIALTRMAVILHHEYTKRMVEVDEPVS